MAAVCFDDSTPDRVAHMEHHITQMPFKSVAVEESVQEDLVTYLRIFGQRNSAIMTFLNKHVRFVEDRYHLANPPHLEYGPIELKHLAVARKIVRSLNNSIYIQFYLLDPCLFAIPSAENS